MTSVHQSKPALPPTSQNPGRQASHLNYGVLPQCHISCQHHACQQNPIPGHHLLGHQLLYCRSPPQPVIYYHSHGSSQNYTTSGFTIQYLLMDRQFKTLGNDLATLHIALSTVFNNEHVSEVEHRTYNTLPLHNFPPRLLIKLVYTYTF
jgi:hypothetical protein